MTDAEEDALRKQIIDETRIIAHKAAAEAVTMLVGIITTVSKTEADAEVGLEAIVKDMRAMLAMQYPKGSA